MLETTKEAGREASQTPQVPTGLDYTTRNCNSPAVETGKKRAPGRNCGKYTLIGQKQGKYSHHRFRCKGYGCGICGPKKIRMVRKRIAQHAVERKLTRFLTLTLDPKKLPAGATLKDRIAYLQATWRKMRVKPERKLGKPLVFIAVMELQRNGNPHLHMLVGSYLPKDWISKAWESQGGGRQTRIEYADVHRVSAYLAKYFTEESLCNLPPGTRRFSTSKGLALFARTKSEGVWALVNLSIEYCRSCASGIEGEEHKTEEDGARSLVAFVAGQVPPELADRLSPNNASRLWVEVKPKGK